MKMRSEYLTVMLALGLTACADKTETASSSSDAVEGVGATGDKSCAVPFFSEHPHAGTAQLSDGSQVNVPFWACDAAFSVIFGTVDYDAINKLAANTGYVPIATNVDGTKKAIVRMYMNGYGVSDGGAYKEVIFGYEASAKPITLPWLTDYSTAIPAFLPSEVLVLHRLYLDEPLPIRYGREIFGLDKRLGSLEYDRTSVAGPFRIVDEQQQEIMSGDLTFDSTARSFADFLKDVEETLHVTSLPAPVGETVLDGITVDVDHPGVINRLTGAVQWAPTVSRASRMNINVSGESEIGALLQNANFQARIVLHDPHARFYLSK